MALLTIIVPTYGRAGFLRQLLACLEEELADLPEVDVLVADNHSDDDTPALLAEAAQRLPWLRWHRQPENVGACPNMGWLVEHATAEYVWYFGDDDLVLPGGVRTVLALLRDERPAWLFLPYFFADADGTPRDGVPEPGVVERHATSGDLYRAYHHWLTFISASVIRRVPLAAAVRDVGAANAYAPFLWAFVAALDGPCVVAPHPVVRGSLDISWKATIDSFLTEHVVDLYDDGVDRGLTAEEFAATLDARYLHGDGVWALAMWRTVPFARLVEAARRFPRSAALRAYLWELAAEREDAAALDVLDAAARHAGGDLESRRLVDDGEALFAAGDVAGAAERFAAAARAWPTSATAWNDLAVALHSLGRPDAEAAVQRAVLVAPDDVDARLNRGSILLARGARDAAAADARHALALQPGNAEAQQLLAAADG